MSDNEQQAEVTNSKQKQRTASRSNEQQAEATDNGRINEMKYREMKYREMKSNETEDKAPVLVNADHPYKEEKDRKLVRYPGTDILLEEETAKMLYALLRTLPKGEIVLVSGYRSFEEQEQIWNDSVEENGLEFTRNYVAKPGCSEHQTGLAVDLGLNLETIDFIRPAFPYEGVCQTFRKRAAAYGFIERYQKDKEAVTKIAAEQWHFRYVGAYHARAICEKHMALEEYVAWLKDRT